MKKRSPKALHPTRLLIVDDHLFVRTGLAVMLNREPDLTVVGEAGDGPAALASFAALTPDVVLMDGRMPGAHGAEVTAELLAAFPAARVLLLSVDESEEDVARALAAGAVGYLPKSTPPRELLRAIRGVAAGESYLPAELSAQQAARERRPVLTPRELEVLGEVVKGLPSKQIADVLGVAEITVRVHLTHIFEKLGVQDRTSATTVALQRGIARLQP